jgi:outer membrane murein-binding lipoprotein Lpp
VRGTEFELLAGLDGSTVIAVDEGTVTLAVNGDELEVGSGAMVEVDMEKGLGPLAHALEKHLRNWQAWRAESAKRLELGLSAAIERATGKVSDLEAKIDEAGKLVYARAEALTAALDELDQAVNTLDRASIRQAWQNLRTAAQELRYSVREYNRDLNSVRVAATFASSLEQAIDRTDHKLPPETVLELKDRLAETAATRDRLVEDARQLRKHLFELFRDMRERINVIITNKLPFDEWSQIFGNERLTKTLLDQLLHGLKIFETSEDRHRSNDDKERTGNNAE